MRGLCLALLAAWPLTARAQCPDGSSPPCRSASAPRPVDPNRIAVLPFRVTTADTLLGEGFAELLATELTGEQGPRAIDMATVINVWRRAGGGLRTPLTRQGALSLARQLGAGLLTEGSIVAIGKRLTITTNLISTTSGAPRGGPTKVTASTDSVDAALRLTVTGLVAAIGGEQRTFEGARYTESPEAMRHYMAGLNAWRRGRLIEARESLERAVLLDTTFAQAAFRRYLANTWALPPSLIPPAEATRRAFQLRERLSPPERMLVESRLGTRWPQQPLIADRFADAERVAAILTDSPDAQFLVGDVWLHNGAAIDADAQLDRARLYLERAVAIDSAATAMRHLLEVAIRQRDTTLIRRLLPAYERTDDTGRWPGLFFSWAFVGDEAQLTRLRRRPVFDSTAGSQWSTYTAMEADIPAAPLDELHRLWLDGIRGSAFHGTLTMQYGVVLATRGRPRAAERAWTGLVGEDLIEADRARLWFGLTGMGEELDVQGAIARLSRVRADDPAYTPAIACELDLWRIKQGESVDSARRYTGTCGRALDIVRVRLSDRDVAARALDSLELITRNAMGAGRGYEPYFLARAFESVGRVRDAARVIRYRNVASFVADAPWLYPEEIRLHLAAGDTTRAIRALEIYLPIIADAEPPYIAMRDSLRALLATLKRR